MKDIVTTRTRKKRKPNPFTKILNALMAEKSLGVREAARLCGVSPSTITDWRSGAVPDDFMAVRKLAEALGTSFAFLLTGVEEKQPRSHAPAITEVFDTGDAL